MTKLTRKNYHSPEMQQAYMGVSQYKLFCECEKKAMAIIKGEWQPKPSEALLVGSYVDEYFNGDLTEFRQEHPELFTKQGELKAPYKKAEQIITRIIRDKYFRKKLGGKRQVIMTGMLGGVEWKIMIDSLHRDLIVDGKVMKDCDDVYKPEIGYVPFWKAYGYDIQGAVFQTIASQTLGKVLPFELAVATKEDEPDLRIFRLTPNTANAALGEVRSNVVRFDKIKKGELKPTGCGKCAYCRSQKTLSKKDTEEF